MPKAIVTVDNVVKTMRSSQRWREIRKIVDSNPKGGLLLDYFYKMMGELRKSGADEKQAEKELDRIKARQSQLGEELSMLSIQRIAVMAYLDARKEGHDVR